MLQHFVVCITSDPFCKALKLERPQTFGLVVHSFYFNLAKKKRKIVALPLSSFFSDIFLSRFSLWHISPSLSSVRTHTHSRGEVERLVLACHLSSALTLALITASPLANAASLGRRSMCSRHKRRREFAPGNGNSSHYGIRKSVWCERQFTPAAKRSFCFSLALF